MNKVRFRNSFANGGAGGQWDGNTLPATTPTFTFADGWYSATLGSDPVGRLPASLYGQAPAGDPYLLLSTMWTSRAVQAVDVLGVDTRAPVRRRDQWVAFPGNVHITLVRPDDTITFTQANPGDAWLELLIEPLAGTNELGEVLMDYAREAARERAEVQGVQTDLIITASTTIPSFAGTLRVISQAGAGITVTLPDSSRQQLRDLLIVEKEGAGNVALTPPVGQLINGLATISMVTVNKCQFIRGTGTRYSSCGVL